MTLEEKIKALRKGKYTQEKLAERVGVHTNTLVRWEHRDRIPTADKVKELADALGNTPDYLLADSGELPPDSKNASEEKDSEPYTQTQNINKGMLVYDLGGGKKIELPPTEASYSFLREIVMQALNLAGA